MDELESLREEVRSALEGVDSDELRALVRMVRAMARRRGILVGFNRRRDRARRAAVHAGLRELRDAPSYSRPTLTLLDGGDE